MGWLRVLIKSSNAMYSFHGIFSKHVSKIISVVDKYHKFKATFTCIISVKWMDIDRRSVLVTVILHGT